MDKEKKPNNLSKSTGEMQAECIENTGANDYLTQKDESNPIVIVSDAQAKAKGLEFIDNMMTKGMRELERFESTHGAILPTMPPSPK